MGSASTSKATPSFIVSGGQLLGGLPNNLIVLFMGTSFARANILAISDSYHAEDVGEQEAKLLQS